MEAVVDPGSGFPLPSVRAWSNMIPAQWYPLRYDGRARLNHEAATRAEYEILIDGEKKAEAVRLYDITGNMVREAPVVEVEYLQAVNQTRIVI